MNRLSHVKRDGTRIAPDIILALRFGRLCFLHDFGQGEETDFWRTFRFLREEPVSIAQTVVPDRLVQRQGIDRNAGRINRNAFVFLPAHVLESVRKLVKVTFDWRKAECIQASKQGLAFIHPAQFLIGTQQVETCRRIMFVLIISRPDKLDDQRNVAIVAQVTRYHLQGTAVEMTSRQHLLIQHTRLLDVLLLHVMPRHPQLRTPTARQRRHSA